MPIPEALFVPGGAGLTATALTIGPWDPGLQHAGPPAALLAREAERTGAIRPGQAVRLSYDILGPVPVGPVRVRAGIVRPGRRVELVEAALQGSEERDLMRLAMWRMRVRDDGLGPAEAAPHRPEDGRPESARFFTEEVAYHRALEWRFVHGTFNAPGPAAAWTRPSCSLVAGEPMTPLEHLMVMVDAASGISAELDWTRFSFVNVDLVVSLRRLPRGGWICMDAATHLGGAGAAQCFADLYDLDGRIGRSAQSLLVEPRQAAGG